MNTRQTIITGVTLTLLTLGSISPVLASGAREQGFHKGQQHGCSERGMRSERGAMQPKLDNLSDSQKEQLKAITEAGREQARQRRSEMHELRQRIVQAEHPAERERLATQQAELFKSGVLARAEQRQQINALLSDEQREQWQQQRQQRMERMEKRHSRS